VPRERGGGGKGKGEGEKEGKGEKEGERESVCVTIAGLQELVGVDLSVVLCKSNKGFKGL
jgi:hypothetical protein